MFRTVPLPIIRSFSHYTHRNGLCHTGLLTACEQDQDGPCSVLILLASCQQIYMTYTIAVCTVRETPDDGQRNCLKHIEFYSKNKFEKLVHLVGFIIRIYHAARSPERKIGIEMCADIYWKYSLHKQELRERCLIIAGVWGPQMVILCHTLC